MSGPALSVLMVVKNEEDILPRTLESVAWAHEVVLVDDGSADGTLAAARRFPNVKIHQRGGMVDGFEQHRAYGLSRCTGEWILLLDADEPLSPELAGEIRSTLAAAPEFNGFLLKRCGPLFGIYFEDRKAWMPRLFRKDRAEPGNERVHGQMKIMGAVGALRNPLHHYSKGLETIDRWIETHLSRYTSLIARDLANKGRRVTVWNAFPNMVLRPAYVFLRRFFFRGGWRNGIPGLILDAGVGVATFLAWAKLWEIQTKGDGNK